MRRESGIGYIVIPEGINRDEYINRCKSEEQFFILTEGNEFIPNAFCLKHVLNYIEYPETFKELGSTIVYVNESIHNKPIIIGVIGNQGDSSFISEGELSFRRSFKNNHIGIVGSVKKRILELISLTDKDFSSEISIKSLGNEDSIIKLLTSGKIILQAKNLFKFFSNKGFNLKVKNVDNEKESIIEVSEEKVVLYKEGEGSAKGAKTSETLTEIKDILGSLSQELINFGTTQATASTPTPLTPLAAGFTTLATNLGTLITQIEGLVQKIEEVESKNVFLD